MTKGISPVLPKEIWIGWGHLGGLSQQFGTLTEFPDACLLQRGISRRTAQILDAVSRTAPALLDVDSTGTTLDAQVVESLLLTIGQLCDLVDERFWCQRRFLEIIDKGNRTGRFRIPITRVPVPPVPERASPFQQRKFEAAAAIRPLIAAFVASLGASPSPQGDARWGRVMLSALLFGGLPRARWLLAIPGALEQSPDPTLRWLDLVIETTDRPTRSHADSADATPVGEAPESKIRVLRRWLPDPLTRLLLREIAQSPPTLPSVGATATDASVVLRVIKAYLKLHGIERHLPGSFGKLGDAVKTRMHQYLPPYLVEYAYERIDSTSLSPLAWERLIHPPDRITTDLPARSKLQLPTAQLPPSTEIADADQSNGAEEPRDDSLDDADAAPFRETESDEELWPDQLRELRQIVRRDFPNAGTKIAVWQQEQRIDLLPSVRWIASWVADHLLTPGRHRRAKRRSTVYQFLRTGGAMLAEHLGGSDPTKLGDEDGYAEFYDGVLEDLADTSISERRTTVNALRSFHEYLSARCPDVPSLEDAGIFVVSGRGGSRVDANVISVATYLLAINELKAANAPRERANVIEALCRIAALGFFASLRRSEAIGLMLEDVLISPDEVFLEIRHNRFRILKTDNGRRKLPLHLLMPEAELSAFCAWVTRRRAEATDGSGPIFPEFVRDQGVRDTDPRLGLIVKALQAATGDTTFRFHHLRHSYATRQLLQFWIAEQRARHQAVPDWFLPTDEDRACWKDAKRVRDQILGTADTNRRSILQISQLLGHGSIEITLGSYVHLLDFLLGRTVRRMSPTIDVAALAVLTGHSEVSLRRLREQKVGPAQPDVDDPEALWLDAVFEGPRRRGRPRRQAPPLPEVHFTDPSRLKPPVEPYPLLLHEMEAVNAWLASDGQDIEAIARRFDIQSSAVATAADALQELPPAMVRNFLTQSPANYPTGTAQGKAGVRYAAPHGPAQALLGRQTIAGIEKLRRSGAPGLPARAAAQRMASALVAFIGAWIPETYLAAAFFEVRGARDWIWLLDQIELTKGVTLGSLCSMVHIPGKGPATPRVLVQRAYWLRQLHRKPNRCRDLDLVSANANRHTRGKVIVDIDRQKLLELQSPLIRVANYEAVRLALVAVYCRLPSRMLRRSPARREAEPEPSSPGESASG